MTGFIYSLVLLLTFQTNIAMAQLSDAQKAEVINKNILVNSGFESGKSKWTPNDTADFAIVTSGSNLLTGKISATWDADASADTLLSTALTIPKGLYGKNGFAYCSFQTPSGTATHEIQVYDGSNVLAESSILSSTTPVTSGVNFIFPTSGSISVRIYANADEPLVAIDDCYLGDAANITNVSQAVFAGESYFAGTASCGNWTRASTTIGAFASDTDCPGPTIVRSNLGDWQTTDANLPIQTINNLPPGIYKATFHAGANLTTNNAAALAINDGTTTCEPNYAQSIATNYAETTVSCTFSYTSAGNRSFQLYGASNAGTLTVDNSITTPRISLRFMLERYPLSSQQVYTTDQSDYGWTAYTPTFTGFGTAASIDFKHRRIGSDLLVTGRFVAGTPTAVEPRISLPSGLTSASSSILPATLSLAGTTTTTGSSATFFEEKVLIEPSTTYMVFGKQSSTTGGATKSASASADFATGATVFVNARIPIDGWQTSNKAPQLVNSVVSQNAGVTNIESAFVIFSAGVPSVSTETSDWLGSITDNAVGDITLSLNSGIFSSTPYCLCGVRDGALNGVTCSVDTTTTPSATVQRIRIGTGAATRDDDFNIFCMGQK